MCISLYTAGPPGLTGSNCAHTGGEQGKTSGYREGREEEPQEHEYLFEQVVLDKCPRDMEVKSSEVPWGQGNEGGNAFEGFSGRAGLQGHFTRRGVVQATLRPAGVK